MSTDTSKRILRILTGFLTLVPLARGGAEIICGVALLNEGNPVVPALDAEFRFMGALLFTTGIIFAWLTPQMGNANVTPYVKVVCGAYIFGGAMRIITIIQTGELLPTFWMFGLFTEVVVIPIMLIWHLRLAEKSS